MEHGFSALDWTVVALALALTTLVGAVLGKQHTLRGFFLGGRQLPWWAVSASIAATEISALTLISVPYVVFKPGGNLAYLQLPLIGSLIARAVIAWKIVPLYYEREIYSPYDYVGRKLGGTARGVCSALFVLGGVLSQSARVYITALVLEIVLHAQLAPLAESTGVPTLALSIGLITLFAVLWSAAGGIVTVVWTDLVLLLLMALAAVAGLWAVCGQLDLGFERLWRVGIDSHRLELFDFDTSPVKAYTFWAAVFAASLGNVSAYGVDQMMAQRLFCCRGVREARKAILWSSLGVLLVALIALIGVGLYAYYERNPLTGEALALYQDKGDRILPIFLAQAVPSGLRGLIVAGILAAAISSLDSILTALSQTTVSALWLPWRARNGKREAADAVGGSAERDRSALRAARVLVIVFGALLFWLALQMHELSRNYDSVLDLGLSMAGYTQGALLAAVLLALTRPGSGSGFLWSAPLSVAWVGALAWHGEVATRACQIFAAAYLLAWVVLRLAPDLLRGRAPARQLARTAALAAFLLLLLWIQRHGRFRVELDPRAGTGWDWLPLSFPWYVPAGFVAAWVFGHLLARDEHARGARGSPATADAETAADS